MVWLYRAREKIEAEYSKASQVGYNKPGAAADGQVSKVK